jgi:hypothetical protein
VRCSRSPVALTRRRTALAAVLTVPLSQAQEGQPRLRLDAAAARAAVGRLGLGHLTAHPMNLRLLIVRAAGGLSIERPTQHSTAPGLVERLRPGSAHLHDLRPIDDSAPEHDELGLRLHQRCKAAVHARARSNA